MHRGRIERWLADGGLPGADPALREGAALLVMEALPDRPPLGWLTGWAAGFLPAGEPEAVAELVARALADAGAAAAEVGLTVISGAPALMPAAERILRPTLGDAIRRTAGADAAAGGPLAVLAALAAVPASGVVLALQLCASGHAAALVASAGGAA